MLWYHCPGGSSRSQLSIFSGGRKTILGVPDHWKPPEMALLGLCNELRAEKEAIHNSVFGPPAPPVQGSKKQRKKAEKELEVQKKATTQQRLLRTLDTDVSKDAFKPPAPGEKRKRQGGAPAHAVRATSAPFPPPLCHDCSSSHSSAGLWTRRSRGRTRRWQERFRLVGFRLLKFKRCE